CATSRRHPVHPEFSPPKIQVSIARWQLREGPDWWDTRSENARETAKAKVSHFISTALILGRSACPLGDANDIRCLENRHLIPIQHLSSIRRWTSVGGDVLAWSRPTLPSQYPFPRLLQADPPEPHPRALAPEISRPHRAAQR